MATDSDGKLRLYDVGSGKTLPNLDTPKSRRGSTQLTQTDFGLDGTLALGYENRIEFWDVRKSKLLREFGSLERIKQAGEAAIAKSIGPVAARKLASFLEA